MIALTSSIKNTTKKIYWMLTQIRLLFPLKIIGTVYIVLFTNLCCSTNIPNGLLHRIKASYKNYQTKKNKQNEMATLLNQLKLLTKNINTYLPIITAKTYINAVKLQQYHDTEYIFYQNIPIFEVKKESSDQNKQKNNISDFYGNKSKRLLEDLTSELETQNKLFGNLGFYTLGISQEALRDYMLIINNMAKLLDIFFITTKLTPAHRIVINPTNRYLFTSTQELLDRFNIIIKRNNKLTRSIKTFKAHIKENLFTMMPHMIDDSIPKEMITLLDTITVFSDTPLYATPHEILDTKRIEQDFTELENALKNNIHNFNTLHEAISMLKKHFLETLDIDRIIPIIKEGAIVLTDIIDNTLIAPNRRFIDESSGSSRANRRAWESMEKVILPASGALKNLQRAVNDMQADRSIENFKKLIIMLITILNNKIFQDLLQEKNTMSSFSSPITMQPNDYLSLKALHRWWIDNKDAVNDFFQWIINNKKTINSTSKIYCQNDV